MTFVRNIAEHCFLLAMYHMIGANPDNSERGGRDIASYIDTIYFTKNSLKNNKNFTEKGVAAVHSADP